MRDKLSNLSMRQLRALIQVDQHQSFVEAAAHLHLTPSALSDSIKSLEESLGLRVFDRTTRSVKPTAVGVEFIALVKNALSQLERAVQVASEMRNLERGLVRCVGATSALACLVAPCLTQLWRRAPQIKVEMRTALAQQPVDAMRAGEADFCIGALPREPLSDLEYLPLLHDGFGLVAHRRHKSIQAQRVDLRDIKGVPYVALTTLTMIDSFLESQEDLAPEFNEPTIRVDGIDSLFAVLEQGEAVAILPALSNHHMGREDVRFFPLVQTLPERTIGLSRLRGRAMTPAAQTLWDLVCAHVKKMKKIQGIRISSQQ